MSHRSVVVGGALFLVVLAAALFAGWVAPYGPVDTDPGVALQPPSWAHLMGTDQFGRDVLSRVIHGGPTLAGDGSGADADLFHHRQPPWAW